MAQSIQSLSSAAAVASTSGCTTCVRRQGVARLISPSRSAGKRSCDWENSFLPSLQPFGDRSHVSDLRCVPGPWAELSNDSHSLGEGSGGRDASSQKRRCRFLRSNLPPRGALAQAARCVCKDAMLVSEAAQNLDERARSDVDIFIREIMRLDSRARQDVALLGSKFLKLDARAREDAEKLDMDARSKVARLRHIAMGFEEVARSEIVTAAEEHWSAGALDADLRLADLRARRRAMEDAFVAVQAVKNVHKALIRSVQLRESEEQAEFQASETGGSAVHMDAERRVETSPKYPEGTVTERLAAMEDAYWAMAASLAKANGSQLKDPEEIEFIVAALLDMNEVDGGNGASLLAECASSPDVATRRALAEALAGAPSLWNLGNAGMGALQRLAEDSNPAVAAAAGNALIELKQQWQHQVGDALLFQLESGSESSEDVDDHRT